MDSKVSDSYPSLEGLVRGFRLEKQVRMWNMKGSHQKMSQQREIPKQNRQNHCHLQSACHVRCSSKRWIISYGTSSNLIHSVKQTASSITGFTEGNYTDLLLFQLAWWQYTLNVLGLPDLQWGTVLFYITHCFEITASLMFLEPWIEIVNSSFSPVSWFQWWTWHIQCSKVETLTEG